MGKLQWNYTSPVNHPIGLLVNNFQLNKNWKDLKWIVDYNYEKWI